jgi:hypothetical protein
MQNGVSFGTTSGPANSRGGPGGTAIDRTEPGSINSAGSNAAGVLPSFSGGTLGGLSMGLRSSVGRNGSVGGSASAQYSTHDSSNGRFGFTASASAGMGSASAGISSFGSNSSGLSGLGAAMAAQMHAGSGGSISGSGPGAGSRGGPGAGGAPQSGSGGNRPGAAVHLKLTF